MALPEKIQRLLTSGGYFESSSSALLLIEGPDAERYLNGQLSNSVSKAQTDRSITACLLTAKGKLCGVLRLWRTGNAFLLETPASLQESIQARLEKYVVADDVTITPVDPVPRLLHIFAAPLPPPGGAVASKRLGLEGWDLWLSSQDCSTQAAALEAQGITHAQPEDISWLRINHGIPEWGLDIDENTLPPEAGLETSCIDYTKGCYVGQEVISRLRSVGHVNKLLCGFSVPSSTGVQHGWKILHGNTPVGHITSIAADFGMAHSPALGYVKHGLATPGTRLTLQAPDGLGHVEAEIRKLPVIS